MTERQREIAFLRHLMTFEDTEERHRLEASITRFQRDEHFVQRLASGAGLIAMLALAVFAYGAILCEDFPYSASPFVIRILSSLGLASLICLVTFAVLLMIFRAKLNGLRAECRRMITKCLNSRLGQPHGVSLQDVDPEIDGHERIEGAVGVRLTSGPPESLHNAAMRTDDRTPAE